VDVHRHRDVGDDDVLPVPQLPGETGSTWLCRNR
jgi:hypothetical protein